MRYWLVDTAAERVSMEIVSNSPHDAALKAATRAATLICLADIERGNLYVFRGARRPKPVVAKLAYCSTRGPIDRGDVAAVSARFREMKG